MVEFIPAASGQGGQAGALRIAGKYSCKMQVKPKSSGVQSRPVTAKLQFEVLSSEPKRAWVDLSKAATAVSNMGNVAKRTILEKPTVYVVDEFDNLCDDFNGTLKVHQPVPGAGSSTGTGSSSSGDASTLDADAAPRLEDFGAELAIAIEQGVAELPTLALEENVGTKNGEYSIEFSV